MCIDMIRVLDRLVSILLSKNTQNNDKMTSKSLLSTYPEQLDATLLLHIETIVATVHSEIENTFDFAGFFKTLDIHHSPSNGFVVVIQLETDQNKAFLQLKCTEMKETHEPFTSRNEVELDNMIEYIRNLNDSNNYVVNISSIWLNKGTI